MADWSLHFHVGDEPDEGRQWEDAVRYGFLSGGWAPVPQRAFRLLEVGDQVWVRLTWKGKRRAGYVARATVIRPPAAVQDAVIVVDGVDVPFVQVRDRMRGFYPASREEQDARGAMDTEWQEKRRTYPPEQTAEWVVAVRWDGVLPVEQRLTPDRVPAPGRQTGYLTQPDHLRLLEQAIPRNLAPEQRVEWQDDDFVVTESPAPARADQDQERKEEAEKLAIWLTALYYDRLGWKVHSVEHEDGRGYDLLARRGVAERHLEVKGTTGVLAAPHLGPSQKDCAEMDPDWRLVVLTRALDDDAEAIELTGPEVLECGLEAVRWRVQCNGSGRSLQAVPAQASRL